MEILLSPCVTACCYAIMEIFKLFIKDKSNLKNLIPIVSAIIGGILGGVFSKIYPACIGFADLIPSIVSGILSGLSATGAHQVVKQMSKRKNTEELKKK